MTHSVEQSGMLQVIWDAEATVDGNWEPGGVPAVERTPTPIGAELLNLMGNTSRGPRCEQARMQKVWNILVMRSFHQKGDISLRSQHAHYTARSSGFIKTRWNTRAFYMSRESLVKIRGESFFLSKWQVWGLITFHDESDKEICLPLPTLMLYCLAEILTSLKQLH